MSIDSATSKNVSWVVRVPAGGRTAETYQIASAADPEH